MSSTNQARFSLRLLAPLLALSCCLPAAPALAEEEARTDPVHVAVVGRRDDPVARAMFAAALRLPEAHKLVEWWDRREGPAPRGEDIYPELDHAAAFLCANGACSSPIKSEAALLARLAKVK